MNEPQPYRAPDRRHPHVSHEELRRQLLAADEDRYRLERELRGARPDPSPVWTRWPRRRLAIGVGTIIMTGLAGGLAWQMCPSSVRANDAPSVRVETREVTPQLIVQDPPPAPQPAKRQVRKATPVRLASPASATRSLQAPLRRGVAAPRRERVAPRPLSPGEFGRPRISAY
jgi:hypothetical protein